MAVLEKGTFSLNLGFAQLSGDVADTDRQCAWELYTEISTRVAVCGKTSDSSCANFDGEVLVESMDSLYSFFQETRQIMRRFPVGRIEKDIDRHLGVLISDLMSDVLRPFLEKWQANYRHWWEHESNPRLHPLERQKEYPKLNELLTDWRDMRSLMRELQEKLSDEYKLVKVGNARKKES